MVDELEENTISKVVRDTVIVQVNKLAQDMKSLIEDAKMKIGPHTSQATAPTSCPPTQENTTTSTKCSYADTLINPLSHADSKLAAREEIRARQVMLKGIDQSTKIGKIDGTQLKTKLNKIMVDIGWKGRGIRSAIIQKNKRVLIKVETDKAYRWINKQEHKLAFSVEVGPDVQFKPWSHTVIAFNVSLTINLQNDEHQKELCKVNHLEAETIVLLCWVKPI